MKAIVVMFDTLTHVNDDPPEQYQRLGLAEYL